MEYSHFSDPRQTFFMIDVFDKPHTITKKTGGWELANVPRQYSNVLRTETQKMFLKDKNYISFALKIYGQ